MNSLDNELDMAKLPSDDLALDPKSEIDRIYKVELCLLAMVSFCLIIFITYCIIHYSCQNLSNKQEKTNTYNLTPEECVLIETILVQATERLDVLETNTEMLLKYYQKQRNMNKKNETDNQ